MPYNKEYKPVLSFEYPCYICGYIFSRAKIVLNHIHNLHGYELPTRSVGHRRPPDPRYIYQYDPTGDYDERHYACASCWFHCPNDTLEEIADHVVTVHKPKNVDPTKNTTPQSTPQPEEDEIETSETEDEDVMDIEAYDPIDAQRKVGTPKQVVDAADIMNKLTELSDLFKNMLQ